MFWVLFILIGLGVLVQVVCNGFDVCIDNFVQICFFQFGLKDFFGGGSSQFGGSGFDFCSSLGFGLGDMLFGYGCVMFEMFGEFFVGFIFEYFCFGFGLGDDGFGFCFGFMLFVLVGGEYFSCFFVQVFGVFEFVFDVFGMFVECFGDCFEYVYVYEQVKEYDQGQGGVERWVCEQIFDQVLFVVSFFSSNLYY